MDLLDDLQDKPYTFNSDDGSYPMLADAFHRVVDSGAESLYGDLWEDLNNRIAACVEEWLPEKWLEGVNPFTLGALLMVEWMRETPLGSGRG